MAQGAVECRRMRVLITGGTGSLGQALVKAWLPRADVEYIAVYSRDELKQAQMRERFPDAKLNFRLGDVRDISRLKLAFYGIDTVIHAAALKRVDATANDPLELCKTNIDGTSNVLQASLSAGVKRTLLISSDKACLPANAYGASKFMAEQLTTQFNVYGAPQGSLSSVVRYGNVLYSRGSVLNTWTWQAENGMPSTLTAPGMTRFVISMRGAINLIESALFAMEGGEVFVPTLPACAMEDLAEAVGVARTGINWPYTGLRPGGEKMHEMLMSTEEATRALDAAGVNVILPHSATWREKSAWSLMGSPVFERNSETAQRLTVNELRELLSEARQAL